MGARGATLKDRNHFNVGLPEVFSAIPPSALDGDISKKYALIAPASRAPATKTDVKYLPKTVRFSGSLSNTSPRCILADSRRAGSHARTSGQTGVTVTPSDSSCFIAGLLQVFFPCRRHATDTDRGIFEWTLETTLESPFIMWRNYACRNDVEENGRRA